MSENWVPTANLPRGKCRPVTVGRTGLERVGWVRPAEAVEGVGGPVLALLLGDGRQATVIAPGELFLSAIRRKNDSFRVEVGEAEALPEDATLIWAGEPIDDADVDYSDVRTEPYGGSKLGGDAVLCVHGADPVVAAVQAGGRLALQLETPGRWDQWPRGVGWPFADSVFQLLAVGGEFRVALQR